MNEAIVTTAEQWVDDLWCVDCLTYCAHRQLNETTFACGQCGKVRGAPITRAEEEPPKRAPDQSPPSAAVLFAAAAGSHPVPGRDEDVPGPPSGGNAERSDEVAGGGEAEVLPPEALSPAAAEPEAAEPDGCTHGHLPPCTQCEEDRALEALRANGAALEAERDKLEERLNAAWAATGSGARGLVSLAEVIAALREDNADLRRANERWSKRVQLHDRRAARAAATLLGRHDAELD